MDAIAKIPGFTKKMIDFIDKEYNMTELRGLSKLSDDEIKNTIPGVTKPMANANPFLNP